MDFLVNKMGWPSIGIARTSAVIFYSLEKRIVPRCSIFKVLSLKGLIKKNVSLLTVLQAPEKSFLKKFVTNYEEEVPKFLGVYRGTVDENDGRFGGRRRKDSRIP
ncbi:hypothetical protein RJ639_000445 [Escallonia herrerae]|uniref:Uncharacterized protein n=1 Tax=Escallonia herrerae TaxID=1293975 RepID=A0AA88XEA6_9ASTE|nr:hypothetical protein RJ639_000445 [Escallonia herrerae]